MQYVVAEVPNELLDTLQAALPRDTDLRVAVTYLRGTKVCPVCKRSRPLTEYGSHVSTADKLKVTCKPCCSEREFQWRLTNPDTVYKYQIRNDAKQRREALSATGITISHLVERG